MRAHEFIFETTINEINYGSAAVDIAPPQQQNIIANSTKIGTAQHGDVLAYRNETPSGLIELVFYSSHNKFNAIVFILDGRLHAMKSYTGKGLVYSLMQFLVDNGAKLIIAPPDDKLTPDGLNWIINQIKRNTINITDQHGDTIDPSKLRAEWEHAKDTGISGNTEIIIG